MTSPIATIVALVVLVAGAAGGCITGSPSSSQLRLRSVQSGQIFSQKFNQAYYSTAATGEYEIVLIDDGRPTTPSRPADGSGGQKMPQPLEPDETAPLRQVVHMRVHWRPLKGTKTDHPSATNGVVDWYVTAANGVHPDDRLHYQGAAFVELDRNGQLAKIHVSNAQVALVEANGSLNDPIGRSNLTGTIIARRNDAKVAAIIAPLRLDAATSRARPARSLQQRSAHGGS
jgi:hypothetical protein